MHSIVDMIDANESGDKAKYKESYQNTYNYRFIILDTMWAVNKLKKDGSIKTFYDLTELFIHKPVQSAGAVKYTDCISAEG